MRRARPWRREIAENPPLAVQGIKQVLSYGEEDAILDGERFAAVWNSAFLASRDLMEAMSAFMEEAAAFYRSVNHRTIRRGGFIGA